MADDKLTILIIEDDLDVADMLNAYFRVQGYEVITVNWGEDGIRASETSHPDLVILDIRLPDIDGFEVAKRMRASRHTRDIPIIFLTEKREREDKLHGLEIGGDDYITKPFDIQELRLRVRNALTRSSSGPLTNPITNLPEGGLMDERLGELLNEENWAVLRISLKNLDVFREAYGFIASDDVLRATSVMVHNTIRESGTPNDFLGHLTTTILALVTTPKYIDEMRKRIKTRLDQSLEYFYPLKDRTEKKITKEGFLTIEIMELNVSDGPFKSAAEIKTKLLK